VRTIVNAHLPKTGAKPVFFYTNGMPPAPDLWYGPEPCLGRHTRRGGDFFRLRPSPLPSWLRLQSAARIRHTT